MAVTQLMEQMAIAVLRGDEAAAMALMDQLTESRASGEIHLPPRDLIRVPAGRVGVAVYVNQEAVANMTGQGLMDLRDSLRDAVSDWVESGDAPRVLMLFGIDRIELYEMPASAPPFIANATWNAGEEDDLHPTIWPTAEHRGRIAGTPEYLECLRIWHLPREDRTRKEVMLLRRHGEVSGGCCDRYTSQTGCDCLDVARS